MSAVDRSADGEPGTESDDRQTPEGRPPGSELRSDESRWLRYDHTRRADIDRWDRDTPPRHENEERSADDVRTRVGYERDRVIIRLDPNGRIVRAEVSGTVGQADAPGYITPESRSEAFEKQTSNRPRRTDDESAGPRWLRNDAGKLILDRDGNPIDKRSIGSTVSEQRQARLFWTPRSTEAADTSGLGRMHSGFWTHSTTEKPRFSALRAAATSRFASPGWRVTTTTPRRATTISPLIFS